MIFKNNDLVIKSDFDIKVFRKYDIDTDLVINLNNRTLNVGLSCEKMGMSRMQITLAKSIIIRFSENTTFATIHILTSSEDDVLGVNFEINYENYEIHIIELEYSTEIKFIEKLK